MDLKEYKANWYQKNRTRMRQLQSEYYQENAEHLKEYQNEYKKTNPDILRMSRRKDRLKRLYGLTLEDYLEKLRVQGGVCWICKKPETSKDRNGNIRALSVDHNHKTGETRNLLCDRCNRFIGMIEEEPELLLVFLEYLEVWK